MDAAGMLIRERGKLYYFCSDGTIANVNDDLLFRLLGNFKDPKNITGTNGRWDIYMDKMTRYKGEVMACVTAKNETLIIYEPSVFSSILKEGNPKDDDYINPIEYAKRKKKSASVVRRHCENGRIVGAFKKNGRWFIPKNARYPSDGRRFNYRKDKEE